MTSLRRCLPVAAFVAVMVAVVHPVPSAAQGQPGGAAQVPARDPVSLGKRMYREGVLPSGELMTGTYAGDVSITGEQVICGVCHRRSGLGSSEGQEVVPAVTGDMLYEPLRLPTSKPPLAPELRPAYTDATLKRAIREGIGADGKAFSALMPRYALSDEDLDVLIAYLKTLNKGPGPGVSDNEIHFATVVADSLEPVTREAILDVYAAFIEQKNVETRNESQRAAHAPWHKEWVFGPYRKWVLHVWTLEGPPASWGQQLQTLYRQQPVFALLGGAAPGSWKPVHDFCEHNQVPCLFPDTDLPVVDEDDFYSVYFTRGMALEADTVAQHLLDGGLLSMPVVQVYRVDDPRGQAAATGLRRRIQPRGGRVTDLVVSDASVLTDGFWRAMAIEHAGATAVLWLGASDSAGLWQTAASERLGRIYLSSSLHGVDPGRIPPAERARVYLVHPYELPGRLPRLLARATGWLKAKRIYAPEARREQANAFFALKMAGGALKAMRGFFVREYLLESIEHMVDNASYTSVYPRISLAPGQRVISRGAYVARFQPDEAGGLVAESGWVIPGSNQPAGLHGAGEVKRILD